MQLNIVFMYLFMCLTVFFVQKCFCAVMCVSIHDSCIAVCVLEVSQGSAENDGAMEFTISALFSSY